MLSIAVLTQIIFMLKDIKKLCFSRQRSVGNLKEKCLRLFLFI